MTALFAPSLDGVSGPPLQRSISYATMLCAGCASPIPAGVRFCVNCGADVVSPAHASSPALELTGTATLTWLLRQETAGEYEIEREIARGGMGAVYLATEIQLRRRVVIKVLPPSLTFGEAAAARFRREARTAAALDHPNIVPIFRVGSGGTLMWYSMKLLEGPSLEALLADRGRLDLEQLIPVLRQVAEALDYAHQRGVIHRDIKPANIMLDDRGWVTVTDFGIAKEVRGTSMSGPDSLVGTPSYMSPEQHTGEDVTGAADQYSLAVVAYQCLTGRLPFEAETVREVRSRHVAATPPSLSTLRPDLPPFVGSAIARALAKQKAARFSSVADFVDALAGRRLIAAKAEPRRRRRAVLVGWVAGVTAAALVLYAASARVRQNVDRRAQPQGTSNAPLASSARTPPPVPGVSGSSSSSGATSLRTATRTGAAPPVAVLIVRVTPGWARVYVNGELRGDRPVHREELPPGRHLLRFERPGFVTVDTSVTLRAGRNVLDISLERAAQ